VVFAKWKALSAADKTGRLFWDNVVETWISGAPVPESLDRLESIVKEYPCTESRVFCALQKAKMSGAKNQEKVADGYIGKEKLSLEKQLSILGTLGSNAPFIGLFGTVLGIIKAFADLGAVQGGAGGMSSVTGGLAEALVATAVGLLVAIPSVIFFNIFQKKVKNIVHRAQSLTSIVVGKG
jgi:biopolymer transport protein ExbB